jgi:hypothetical protein
MMSDRLVIVGVMTIMVPLVLAPTLDAIPILAAVLDPSVCILGMKDILKVLITPTLVVLQPRG